VFKPFREGSLKNVPTHRVKLGKVFDPESKRIIDEALVLVMRGPRSFTGEDVVEFQCHGGIIVLQRVLELLLNQGARLAEPGEFTKRAFLNGRIDLSQAEAVIDVIRSKTDLSLEVAIDQLEGSLSKRIQSLRDELYQLVTRIEASIDFPEDDIPEVEVMEMADVISSVQEQVIKLLKTADDGKVLREGIKTVITGKPNVGKSSLLNKLLNENRALVTDIPGTTRDVIEEVLNLQGIPFRILDTAGIRETGDYVEQLGVERSLKALDEADLIVFLLDASIPLSEEDFQILEATKNKKRIIVINKLDLPRAWEIKELSDIGETRIVETSLLSGDIDPLIEAMISFVSSGIMRSRESGIVTRTRHKHALEQALQDLKQALNTVNEGYPVDLVSIGLYGALESLGEITGETVRDNIIEQIFSQFCIGK
jgi:tRNA modification GTPase